MPNRGSLDTQEHITQKENYQIWPKFKHIREFIAVLFIFEPRHEKTGFLHMQKQRRRSDHGNREADQPLCFRYTDSTIPLLPKSEI